MSQIETTHKTKHGKESTSRDSDSELALDICIKTFQGALEAATTSLNKPVDDITIHHVNEIADLKISHA